MEENTGAKRNRENDYGRDANQGKPMGAQRQTAEPNRGAKANKGNEQGAELSPSHTQ